MTLPGVGVFPGDNPRELIGKLRKAGFPVKAVWAQNKKEADELKKDLNLQYVTSCIRELVLHTEVDLVIIDSPPPTHQQICANALGIGKHVVCSLPGGLNLRDARKMFESASYYPQLLAAASNPVRFLEPIMNLRNLVKTSSAGQVYMVEAKMKSNPDSEEQWKLDNRMGGGALSLLGGCLADIVSHVIDECASRAIGTTSRSPTRPSCDSFATFQLTFPSGTLCSGTVAFSDVFEFELIITCARGVFRMDSNLNVSAIPTELLDEVIHPRTESVIENSEAEVEPPEAIDTEVEVAPTPEEDHLQVALRDFEHCGTSNLIELQNGENTEESGEIAKIIIVDQSTQATPSKRDAATETTNANIESSSRVPFVKRGLPYLFESIKEAFLAGGPDRKSWADTAINDSPIGKFSDILYVQGVLDALRRSDRSGEVENVETGDELKLEVLNFQAEFSVYAETVDHLQI